MEAEQRLHVGIHPPRVVGEAVGQVALALELALLATHLGAKVGAPRGQVSVPVEPRDVHVRAGVALQLGPAQDCGPGMAAGQPLRQQHVPAFRPAQASLREGRPGRGQVLGRADRPELVSGAMPDESRNAHRALAVDHERQDGRHAAVGRTAGQWDLALAGAVVPPPDIGPLPGGKQVARAIRQSGPLVPERGDVALLLDRQRRACPRLLLVHWSGSMAGSRGNPVRHGLRFVAHVLILSGVLLIADAGATVAWQEPVTAFLTNREQATLKRALENPPRRVVEKEPLEGDAIGKIEFPTLDKSLFVVEGTDRETLRKGPGHYPETPLPGERGTVAIAGHRTTNGAPFRKIDKLKPGDPVIVSMPYGRYVYRVEKTKLVDPTETSVKRRSVTTGSS